MPIGYKKLTRPGDGPRAECAIMPGRSPAAYRAIGQERGNTNANLTEPVPDTSADSDARSLRHHVGDGRGSAAHRAGDDWVCGHAGAAGGGLRSGRGWNDPGGLQTLSFPGGGAAGAGHRPARAEPARPLCGAGPGALCHRADASLGDRSHRCGPRLAYCPGSRREAGHPGHRRRLRSPGPFLCGRCQLRRLVLGRKHRSRPMG